MARTWLILAALLLTPIAVYWPTIAQEYGFRDDYAHLREAREYPEGLIRFTSADGRPLYGHLLVVSVGQLERVADLSTLRLLAALLLSLVGLLLWRQLRLARWSGTEAATMAIAATLLPGAQVLASWAIAWPIALGLVCTLAGFALVEQGLSRPALQRTGFVLAGGVLYFAAGLIYQTTVLFAVMPLAALLLLRNSNGLRDDAAWFCSHVGMLFIGLFGGWLLMNAVFASGAVAAHARLGFESDPLLKLLWFVRNPLPNSMALFALRDRIATPLSFFITLVIVVVIIACGFRYGLAGRWQRQRWLFVALVLPFVAHSISLAASSQAIGYRTLLPLSGLFLVLAMFGLRALMARLGLHRAVRGAAYAGILVCAAWLARHNSFTLIAEPQALEWQMMQAAASRVSPGMAEQVFIVRPGIDDRATLRMYADEFGTQSSDAPWAAKEMFDRAMSERFPAGLPRDFRYTLGSGPSPPQIPVDLMLDMRLLKQQRERAAATTPVSQG